MPARVEWAAGILAGLLLAAPAGAAESVPDAGFLEFLGMLVEDEGEYLDPLDMADVDWPVDRQAQTAGGSVEQSRVDAGDAVESDDEDED